MKSLLGCVLALLLAFSRAEAQNMPDPKEIAGVPLPVGDVPVGTVTVRVIRGQMSNNVAEQPVDLIVAGVARTMKTLSNVRVRNVATLGGSLAHADPHLDLPAVWLALGAKAVILAPAGERMIDVADIFAGYYETTLKNNELIAELIVPVRPGWQSTYVKVTTRASHDWPALGLAVCAEIVDRSVKDLRLVLSAAVDKPTRLLSAEAILRGGDIDRAALRRAGDAAVEEAAVASDSRGSALYKQHLLRVHLGRAIDGMIAEASR